MIQITFHEEQSLVVMEPIVLIIDHVRWSLDLVAELESLAHYFPLVITGPQAF